MKLETTRKKKDERLFSVSICGLPAIINAKCRGLLGIFTDISE